jgi:acetyl-CoA synthetase
MTWFPDAGTVAAANLTRAMADRGCATYGEFYAWSVAERPAFWADVIDRLGIAFAGRPRAVLGTDDPLDPQWMKGARLNIAESCFSADPERTAVIHGSTRELTRVTYGQLQADVWRCANGLDAIGVTPGVRVGIAMPMSYQSVVAYLGTVWVGGTVVSIADSFAAPEIATRLRIAEAHLVVTQDRVVRGGKELPMVAKVFEAGVDRAIVVDTGGRVALRPVDLDWTGFMANPAERPATRTGPDHRTNILFSSGTTGDPKAIPWTQVTPIKAAMDGHFHQDIHASDVVAWPTNLGWMMGPWLIYATLINGAAMALHDDVPSGQSFAGFVETAGVTILGVVPSLVGTWRSTGGLDGADWSRIRLFSTTGEASKEADMEWLMGVAGGRPIIEYCGGTEIGGGYLTSTVLHPSVPSHFSTATLGLDLVILDEEGNPADQGEVFLEPPSIGLSETLLNRDHFTVYHAETPSLDGRTLRRHGDELVRLPDGTYRVLGRADDAMNLGGIKVGSAELERAIADTPGLVECAAIAVPKTGGGPSSLVIFAVAATDADPGELRTAFTERIRKRLNPLFKVARVVLVDALPRTASGKVMRRELRDRAAVGD